MRQQLAPSEQVHGVITDGGKKPNIIPDKTAGAFYVRYHTISLYY
jgi:metal-dependent amidase/aminoacylase/carboxypeptidase family protein